MFKIMDGTLCCQKDIKTFDEAEESLNMSVEDLSMEDFPVVLTIVHQDTGEEIYQVEFSYNKEVIFDNS